MIIEMAQEYFKTKLKEIKRIDLYAVKKVAVRKKDKDIDIGKHLLEPLLVLTIGSIQDGIRNISIRSNSIKKMVSEHLGNIPIQSIKVQKVDN